MIIFLLSLTEITRLEFRALAQVSLRSPLLPLPFTCFSQPRVMIGRMQSVFWAIFIWLLIAGLILNFQENFHHVALEQLATSIDFGCVHQRFPAND